MTATPPERQPAISRLVDERSIIVCCGSGGVGKTTTAAALAVEAARRGRNACVVTIDPARRLANALGLDTLTNRPAPIDGPWPGRLHALMLDPKATFDDLVARYADSEEQAERIRQNRIYRNLTSTLSGTQEYMAAEKLYELTEEHEFELVVVDTPPTRNALDFLDAPGRLTRFLENRVFQALVKPARSGLRVMGVAAHAVLRTLSRVAGTDIVSDGVAFFQAFEGMEEGFRARASRVRELLRHPATAYVLVASPRADSVEEAVHFADKLAETGVSVSALIVNRVLPRFADDLMLDRLPATSGTGGGPLEELAANLRGFTWASDREEETYAKLVSKVAPAPVYKVALLPTDVHDVEGLEAVGDLLFGRQSPTATATGPPGDPAAGH